MQHTQQRRYFALHLGAPLRRILRAREPIHGAQLSIFQGLLGAKDVSGQVFLRNGPCGLEVGEETFAILQARQTGRQIRKGSKKLLQQRRAVHHPAEGAHFPAHFALYQFPGKFGGPLGGAAGPTKGGGNEPDHVT